MILDRGKLEEVLKSEQIENTKDLQRLMRSIMKDAIEADGEITDHLGYDKHQQKAGSHMSVAYYFKEQALSV